MNTDVKYSKHCGVQVGTFLVEASKNIHAMQKYCEFRYSKLTCMTLRRNNILQLMVTIVL